MKKSKNGRIRANKFAGDKKENTKAAKKKGNTLEQFYNHTPRALAANRYVKKNVGALRLKRCWLASQAGAHRDEQMHTTPWDHGVEAWMSTAWSRWEWSTLKDHTRIKQGGPSKVGNGELLLAWLRRKAAIIKNHKMMIKKLNIIP
jgi:hypothetical protein